MTAAASLAVWHDSEIGLDDNESYDHGVHDAMSGEIPRQAESLALDVPD
jgi:hypothetical protein